MFQVRPQSSRLTVPAAVKMARWPPQESATSQSLITQVAVQALTAPHGKPRSARL
jgi:hypothetical protein